MSAPIPGDNLSIPQLIQASMETIRLNTIRCSVLNGLIADPSFPQAEREVHQAEYMALEGSTDRLSNTILRLQRLQNATAPPVAPVVAPVPVAPAPVRNVTVCPRNLPLFQWENAIFDSSAPVFVDVTACLRKFEDVLFAHGLSVDLDFVRLVPQLLSDSQRTWYEQFITAYELDVAPPSWNDFRLAITSRYGRTVDEDRADCAVKLIKVVVNQGESL
ncbi:hypothetical protein ABG067_008189, partial [Albugo candida]